MLIEKLLPLICTLLALSMTRVSSLLHIFQIFRDILLYNRMLLEYSTFFFNFLILFLNKVKVSEKIILVQKHVYQKQLIKRLKLFIIHSFRNNCKYYHIKIYLPSTGTLLNKHFLLQLFSRFVFSVDHMNECN